MFMKQLLLFFILIRHGIWPFSKTSKVKFKLNRFTKKENQWIDRTFGNTRKILLQEEK